jgi:hypothetical protein
MNGVDLIAFPVNALLGACQAVVVSKDHSCYLIYPVSKDKFGPIGLIDVSSKPGQILSGPRRDETL